MDDPSTSNSVYGPRRVLRVIASWFFLVGNRLAVAGIIISVVVVIVLALVRTGLIDVGASSSASTMFGSGVTSGVITLVTVALSINQLILSRVFGSPGDLRDRLEGTHELRRQVETIAGEPSSPNDPAAFLAMTAQTLQDRCETLENIIDGETWEPPDEFSETIRDIDRYGEHIESHLVDEASIVDILYVIMGTEYAKNMTAIRHLQQAASGSPPRNVQLELEAIETLIDSIGITRQFFKTVALQEDFARLSRLIVYSGILALLVSISLTLIYRTDSVTIPLSSLPLVVSCGIGIVVAPLATFGAYLLRAATIAERTVSVGPFIPPKIR